MERHYAHCEHCPDRCYVAGTHTVPCDHCAEHGGPGTTQLPTAEETRNVR